MAIENSKLFFKISFLISLLSILVPFAAQGAPAQREIQTLEPTMIIYTTPFDDGVEGALRRRCMLIHDRDITRADFGVAFGLGGKIEIWQTPVYQVADGRKTKLVRSWGLTVGEVLSDDGIEIGDKDIVSPSINEAVSPNLKIGIVRVLQTEVRVTEDIDFKTIERDDATLERGTTKVAQEGEEGQREKTYLVRREDGEEVSRSLINNKIIKEPQNKITLHGTKIVVLSSESGSSSWTFGATASRRYKKGTLVRVTNLANSKSVEAIVGGYGPMESTGRILDLNVDAWEKIASSGQGTVSVKVEEIKQ